MIRADQIMPDEEVTEEMIGEAVSSYRAHMLERAQEAANGVKEPVATAIRMQWMGWGEGFRSDRRRGETLTMSLKPEMLVALDQWRFVMFERGPGYSGMMTRQEAIRAILWQYLGMSREGPEE